MVMGEMLFPMTVDAVSEVVCVSVVLHCGGGIELYFLNSFPGLHFLRGSAMQGESIAFSPICE
jgi:hypothetical protein